MCVSCSRFDCSRTKSNTWYAKIIVTAKRRSETRLILKSVVPEPCDKVVRITGPDLTLMLWCWKLDPSRTFSFFCESSVPSWCKSRKKTTFGPQNQTKYQISLSIALSLSLSLSPSLQKWVPVVKFSVTIFSLHSHWLSHLSTNAKYCLH